MKDLLLSFGGLVLLMICLVAFPPLGIILMVIGVIAWMLIARDAFDKNTKKKDSSVSPLPTTSIPPPQLPEVMVMKPKFLSKLTIPKDNLHGKKLRISFSRDGGRLVETGVGEIMVAGPNRDGFCEVIVQLLDMGEEEWVRLHLSQPIIDSITKASGRDYDYECPGVLTDGLDLGKKK